MKDELWLTEESWPCQDQNSRAKLTRLERIWLAGKCKDGGARETQGRERKAGPRVGRAPEPGRAM